MRTGNCTALTDTVKQDEGEENKESEREGFFYFGILKEYIRTGTHLAPFKRWNHKVDDALVFFCCDLQNLPLFTYFFEFSIPSVWKHGIAMPGVGVGMGVGVGFYVSVLACCPHQY